jgi:hypothetical protein
MSGLDYMSGFGGHFESEAVEGALPKGRNSPQRPAFGLYAEQLSGSAFTHAATREPAQLAVSDAADRRPPAVRFATAAPIVRSSRRPRAACAQPAALGPAGGPSRRHRFRRRAGDDAARARGPRSGRLRGAPVPGRPESMERRVFVNADGELLIIPQQGSLGSTPSWAHRDRAGFGRAGPARDEVPGELTDGPARGYVAENYGLPVPPCPTSARSAPTASPIRATSRRRSPGSRIATKRPRSSRNISGSCGRRPSTIRRSTSSPGTAITRPGATSCRPVQHDRHRQLRPSRPVDLHRADQPEQRAGPGQCRFRHLPAALDGRRGHVPPALVPPQRDERGDGPDHGEYDAKAEASRRAG